MHDVNIWAIIVAAFVTFVASSVYYIILGKQLATVSTAFKAALDQKKQPAWKPLFVFLEHVAMAFVLVYIFQRMNVTNWLDAAWVGVVLWFTFSALQWASSMVWEKTPLKLALIHAGDWLMTIVLMAIIVGAWQ